MVRFGEHTCGIWRQRFGFGPGTRTSRRNATRPSSLAKSRAVIPSCRDNSLPIMSSPLDFNSQTANVPCPIKLNEPLPLDVF